jgi:hypothetical protein
MPMTHDDAPGNLPERISAAREAPEQAQAICPFCQSHETERMALFGSQLSTAQYYCRACHTPFQYLRQESPAAR